nr:pantetheine-phosphate adenylyltransferase [Gammaproteobacteria bacterium]
MRAIYPGTFNPITNGHMNLVVRALKLFPKLTIAVAASEHKNPYFSLEKRLQLCKQALTEYPQVEVISFNDLLIECALREKATFIIRGLRGSVDFDYEQQ